MTKRIAHNKFFLQALQKSKAMKRKGIIQNASKDNINALSEVALNTLLGNVPLSDQHKKKLKRHRFSIRNLAKAKVSLKNKKDFLIQKGGFLPLLISPVLSLLGGLAADAISHAVGL